MQITLQKQPNNKTCGQTSLAMALGVDVSEIIQHIGHSGITFTKDYIRIIRLYGKECDDQMTKVDNRKFYWIPEFCLLRINKWGKKTGHLMLYYKGICYDSGRGGRTFPIGQLKEFYPNYRIDRYLEIRDGGKL